MSLIKLVSNYGPWTLTTDENFTPKMSAMKSWLFSCPVNDIYLPCEFLEPWTVVLKIRKITGQSPLPTQRRYFKQVKHCSNGKVFPRHRFTFNFTVHLLRSVTHCALTSQFSFETSAVHGVLHNTKMYSNSSVGIFTLCCLFMLVRCSCYVHHSTIRGSRPAFICLVIEASASIG